MAGSFGAIALVILFDVRVNQLVVRRPGRSPAEADSLPPRDNGRPEADGELLDLHVAIFGGEEMPQLVEKNDESQTQCQKRIIKRLVKKYSHVDSVTSSLGELSRQRGIARAKQWRLPRSAGPNCPLEANRPEPGHSEYDGWKL